MRIYFDNCCFNRPFDDQRHARIRLEGEAKSCIQEGVRDGRLELVWSYMLEYENAANPFAERQRTIARWKEHATVDMEETDAILASADSLVALGLKPKDALHVACAIAGECDYFLTTDDQILRKAGDIQGISVLDPLSFVRERNL